MAYGKPATVAVIAALAFFYQSYMHTLFNTRFGLLRAVEYINNDNCEQVHELESCEDGWLHQPSGKLYMTCSTQAAKWNWLPNADLFHPEQATDQEYLAILDTKASGPYASRITKVRPQGFAGHDGRGTLMLHGMGVYMGEDGRGGGEGEAAEKLRLFLINHRVQADAQTVGANSTVELFETTLGSNVMRHLHTYAAPEIFTPNNLVPTGPNSFYFSNDHSVKIGFQKKVDFLLPRSSIGHCDVDGCKIVEKNIMYANGLAGALQHPALEPNVLYKASSNEEYVTVYDIQADKSLTVKDRIKTGYVMDNINMVQDGSLVVSAFPKPLDLLKIFGTRDSKSVAASLTIRISKNLGKDSFYGNKWKVDKIFEDDGHVASGMTNSALDTERKLLFLGGE